MRGGKRTGLTIPKRMVSGTTQRQKVAGCAGARTKPTHRTAAQPASFHQATSNATAEPATLARTVRCSRQRRTPSVDRPSVRRPSPAPANGWCVVRMFRPVGVESDGVAVRMAATEWTFNAACSVENWTRRRTASPAPVLQRGPCHSHGPHPHGVSPAPGAVEARRGAARMLRR